MSVGPTSGIAGSAAGAPLAQTRGSEVDRAQRDSSSQQRQVDGERQAESAAGIGQTDEDQEASDRDADGRRLWEAIDDEQPSEEASEEAPKRNSKDATGASGNTLDLSG